MRQASSLASIEHAEYARYRRDSELPTTRMGELIMTFDDRYRRWAQRSGELFAEASQYIPGGAGSSARTVKFGWRPYPPFMAQGYGSRLRDVDGHEYVD